GKQVVAAGVEGLLDGVGLGGADDEVSYIEQQVTVPVGMPYLAYWHWIASQDACGFDIAFVRVNGSTVNQYDLCTSQDTGGWVKRVVDLSAFQGQSVTLQIRVETNSSLNSNLFVDDVAFQSSPTAPENARSGRVGEDASAPKPEELLR
ncbi:MAG: hypothetical protein IIC89_00320, partial [Chloroflexi bacterium]|nr:hypothetical protein [Chloroflexota bacterium]